MALCRFVRINSTVFFCCLLKWSSRMCIILNNIYFSAIGLFWKRREWTNIDNGNSYELMRERGIFMAYELVCVCCFQIVHVHKPHAHSANTMWSYIENSLTKNLFIFTLIQYLFDRSVWFTTLLIIVFFFYLTKCQWSVINRLIVLFFSHFVFESSSTWIITDFFLFKMLTLNDSVNVHLSIDDC